MVLLTVVAATSVRMVAPGGPLTVVAPSSADHLVVALCLALVAEVVVQQGDPVDCWCVSGFGMSRGIPVLPR